jgi:MbtH protein
MTNPFEDDSRSYVVLCNSEEQYSLWPATIDVPAGWTVVHYPDTRQACLEYVEENWTDMRPKTVREASRADSVQ